MSNSSHTHIPIRLTKDKMPLPILGRKLMLLEKEFFVCGLTGWCLEIIYTSLHSFRKKDLRLMGNTSIWMFPIYGLASVISLLYPKIKHLPIWTRGTIYGAGILGVEYVSGSMLKKHHSCPWDYSEAKLNINGLIRLDYAPLWAFAGLLFETILRRLADNEEPTKTYE